jgi:hypothetical protein
MIRFVAFALSQNLAQTREAAVGRREEFDASFTSISSRPRSAAFPRRARPRESHLNSAKADTAPISHGVGFTGTISLRALKGNNARSSGFIRSGGFVAR